MAALSIDTPTSRAKDRGSLFVVGSGHRIAGQVTLEALRCIEKADKVLYSGDSITEEWITKIVPNAETLDDLYAPGKDRHETYEEMVDRILRYIRKGLQVCV